MSRGSDAALIVLVGALGAFVVVQVMSRAPAPPTNSPAAPATKNSAPQTAARPAAASTPSATNARGAASSVATQSATTPTFGTAPARDVAAIKALIDGTPGTYMASMLADLGGVLVRWPDRTEQGLRVWVQSASDVHDFNAGYAQMARDAFADWGSAGDGGGVPVRLDFVLDSASSDIQIVWIERFPPDMGRRVGSTDRATDKQGWISSARITVAIHDSAGRTIAPKNLTGIVRHEAGHALGLGHSNDPNTKMYAVEMVNDIRPADRATLRLLYRLTPGPVP